MSEENQPPGGGQSVRKVTLNYTKSNLYRVIRIDAVRGAITPDGDVYVELCVEKPTLPERVILELDEEGQIQNRPENSEVHSPVWDREIEVSTIMNSEAAVSLAELLLEIVEALDDFEEDDDEYNNEDEDDSEESIDDEEEDA